MHLTHLHVYRQASDGSPSQAEIARRMKVSREMVRRFEGGETPLSPDGEAAYARAVGGSREQVHRLFQLSALSYHKRRVAEITQEMQSSKPARRRA